MSYSFFDLNICNYSLDELKTLIKLEKNYNYDNIQNNISTIKDKITKLNLEKNENRVFFSFLDNVTLFLKNDLALKENNKLKNNIFVLQNNQEKLKKELKSIKK